MTVALPGREGQLDFQEAPIAHQRSGLLSAQPRLERFPSPPPSIFRFRCLSSRTLFQARHACLRQLFGAPLRPINSVRLSASFPHVNIMCLSISPRPRNTSALGRVPCKPPDPKEPLLRKQSVALAAVALIVSVGMASAQQRTPPQYDRIRSGLGSPEQNARPDVRSNPAGPRQRQLGSPSGRWPHHPALNRSFDRKAAGRREGPFRNAERATIARGGNARCAKRVIGNDRWAWSAVPGREKLLAPAWFGGRI